MTGQIRDTNDEARNARPRVWSTVNGRGRRIQVEARRFSAAEDELVRGAAVDSLLMPLAWDEQMRLLRVGGLAEEVLGAAQASSDDLARAGLGEQVNFLMNEVYAVLIESDAAAAAEFERIVMRGPEADISAELKAAALVGWVKAELMTQARYEENAASHPRKKQTIGFKIRSPITREHAVPEEPARE